MPLFAAELEKWWLSHGQDAIYRLVNPDEDGPRPHECGFAQAIQRRLRNFDNDKTIQDHLNSSWKSVLGSSSADYDVNPRKHLKDASRTIFRRLEDGGIDRSRAMEGLGYLDSMEIQRCQLIEATKLAMKTGFAEQHHKHVIEELHRTATHHFSLFHMGFRVCVSDSYVVLLSGLNILTNTADHLGRSGNHLQAEARGSQNNGLFELFVSTIRYHSR